MDATDASENDEFTFTVDLKDSEGNAIEGEYDAEKGDETLTVKSGDTVTLKGGEEILIKGLPHGTVYEVTEAEKANWEMTDSSGTTGTLEPGETAEASFENTYHEPEKQPYSATGSVKFTAKKKVEGGTILEDDGFTFELIDENGEVIQTKTCDKVSTDDEAVTESTITFDKIEYDLDDLKYDEEAIEAHIQAQLDAYQQNYDEAKYKKTGSLHTGVVPDDMYGGGGREDGSRQRSTEYSGREPVRGQCGWHHDSRHHVSRHHDSRGAGVHRGDTEPGKQ